MKVFTIITLLVISMTGYSQDIRADISSAKSDFVSEDFESARTHLQNALYAIDKILAEEILKLLPQNLGSLSVDPGRDSKGGSGTSMGLFVTREYGAKDGDYAELSILDNSPMMAMVNAFLSNPMLAGLAGQATGKKPVKIDGYKGMLQKEEGETGAYSIMIPFGDSMLTFETNIQDESEAISMAQQVPLGKIVALVQ